MDVFAIISFTFALVALGIVVMNQTRINNLEKKLKEFDVIPQEFKSETPASPPASLWEKIRAWFKGVKSGL